MTEVNNHLSSHLKADFSPKSERIGLEVQAYGFFSISMALTS